MKWIIVVATMLSVVTAYAASEATTVAPSTSVPIPSVPIQVTGTIPAERGTVLIVEDAIRVALKGSPGLQAIRARAQALSQVPAQKGALPDPSLSLQAANLPVDSFAVGQEAMTQLQLGLAQTFPFPGKLGLMSAVADDQARMADYDVSEWRLQLVRDIRTLWWRLAYLDRALEIVISNQALLRQFVTIAQTKYRVGRGLQQDVLLAQLELSKMLDQELVLRNQRQTDAVRINTLMGVEVGRVVILPVLIDQNLPDVPPESEFLQRAGQHRPALMRQDAAIAMAQSGIDLARKDYYPDVTLGAAYGLRSGANPDGSGRADLLSLSANIKLPVFAGARQDRRLDQRQRELLEQRFQKQDVTNRVNSEVAVAYADFVRARQQTRLFLQGIIPQANQTVASMRSGYEVNKVDFLNLIRAQVTLFSYQTRYWLTLSQAHEALARLFAATGQENFDEY